MKKLFIVYMLFAYSYSSFAANIYDVPEQAKEAFKRQYPCALYATWEALRNNTIYVVRFVYNNQSLAAYYDADGTAIGFARPLTLDKLPVKIKEVLDKRFAGCQILRMHELVLQEEHLFCLDVSTLEEKLFIVIDNNGRIQKRKKLSHY